MKKQLLTIIGSAFLCMYGNAQLDKSKMMPCGTFDAMEEGFKLNPQVKRDFDASQTQFEIEYEKAITNFKTQRTAATIYTVPVVFHIMGNQSISDQTFINFIANVNKDYAKQGSDVGLINSNFSSLYVDSEIRFALAQKDPNGNCTNGIIRHNSDSPYWSQSSPNYAYSGTGTNRWPTNRYLNVYIVDCISSATYSCPVTTGAYLAGYTYLPGSTPYTQNGNMGDAIVYLKSMLGQSDPTDSRTLSHEIGHWLNLSHTFGSSNNPKFDPSNMPTTAFTCSSDNVADTPPTGGYFSYCPSTYSLDCTSLPNIENIMDYASCPRMFTQGQTTRMRTAITSATGGRSNLWSASNYDFTGLTSTYTCSPIADFDSDKIINCSGSAVTYNSTSQIGASGNLVWTFQGGNPSTSTSSVQSVTYSTPGTYSVSLIASNPTGTNTINRTSYVNVIDASNGVILPNLFDFEAATLPSSITVINGNSGSVTWNSNPTYGANSTSKSIYLNNFPSSNIGGHIDIFETPIYDFSNTTSVGMSFYYAYAKRSATQVDTFRIQYSLDCGGNWSNFIGAPTTAVMAAASGGTMTTVFNPTPSTKWIYKNIPGVINTALNNKPSVKFRFYFRVDPTKTTANNMFLDQINISGNVSIPTAVSELEKSLNLVIYPNPTASSSVLNCTIAKNKTATVNLMDVTGRIIEQSFVKGDNDGYINHVINANSNLAAGIYIVNIDIDGQRISKKLIVE
jgi:PKD repeat protein